MLHRDLRVRFGRVPHPRTLMGASPLRGDCVVPYSPGRTDGSPVPRRMPLNWRPAGQAGQQGDHTPRSSKGLGTPWPPCCRMWIDDDAQIPQSPAALLAVEKRLRSRPRASASVYSFPGLIGPALSCFDANGGTPSLTPHGLSCWIIAGPTRVNTSAGQRASNRCACRLIARSSIPGHAGSRSCVSRSQTKSTRA